MGNLSRQRGLISARTAAGGGVIANAATALLAMQVENSIDGWISVDVVAVLGSLTNYTITPQVSDDGSTWRTLTDPGALGPLTASQNSGFACNCKGWKFFRVSLSSTGTTTGSSAAVNYRYQVAGGVV